MPPRLKPENTTLPEIMKRGGYHTGVIASHEYWNDWGMDQGVDDYDNSIGKTARSVPRRRRQGHRSRARVDLAPAGQEVVPVGALHRSARPLRRAPRRRRLRLERARPLRRRDPVDRSADRPPARRARAPAEQRPNTIIVITSDHGDSMGEHNVPVGTHGTALYRELQHVPMIFYIPDNQPRADRRRGRRTSTSCRRSPSSPASTSTTCRSRARARSPRSSTARKTTSASCSPRPTRRRRSAPRSPRRCKLIYYLNSNLYELFDLKADPWEHDNLAPQTPAGVATR